jgi:ribosomal protein L37AE/L43A
MSILEEADKIINGDRATSYGNPLDMCNKIALFWEGIIGKRISAEDVALMMILLKVARETNKHSKDNILDIAGYAGVHEKITKLRAKKTINIVSPSILSAWDAMTSKLVSEDVEKREKPLAIMANSSRCSRCKCSQFFKIGTECWKCHNCHMPVTLYTSEKLDGEHLETQGEIARNTKDTQINPPTGE